MFFPKYRGTWLSARLNSQIQVPLGNSFCHFDSSNWHSTRQIGGKVLGIILKLLHLKLSHLPAKICVLWCSTAPENPTYWLCHIYPTRFSGYQGLISSWVSRKLIRKLSCQPSITKPRIFQHSLSAIYSTDLLCWRLGWETGLSVFKWRFFITLRITLGSA